MFTLESPFLLLMTLPLWYCIYKCKLHYAPKNFVHLNLFVFKRQFVNWFNVIPYIIVFLIIFVLSSPIQYDPHDPRNRNGINIVLSIDASGSMVSSGFDSNNHLKSRFEAVQDIATSFINKRLQDNIGIVLFGDFAFIASPVTYENSVVAQMLGWLNSGMAGESTAIGEAIEQSLRALDFATESSKIVILLTDGKHNSGRISPKDAVALAKQMKVKIYTIGIGKKGEYDDVLLKRIATDSGAEFFEASSAEDLINVYKKIDTLHPASLKSGQIPLKNHLGFPFLLSALFLILFWTMRRFKGLDK